MADFFKKHTVPILLYTLLCSSTVYIYARSDLAVVTAFTLASAVYAALLFALYEALSKLKKTLISSVVIVAVMFISLLLSGGLIETNYVLTFQWMLEPSSINHIYVGNIAALLLDFGFVLGSALYYFTAVRFRSIFVFLICMCPFSLFAKTFTSIPVIYIILIATLFFVLMIMKASGESVVYSRRSYIAFGSFVVAVVSAAAFLPKLENAPYRKDFDELITGISIGGAGGLDFSGFTNASSYSSSDDETVVFTFYGDNPERIKRQCFNLYDPISGQWEYSGPADTGYNNWNIYVNWEDPSLLLEKFPGTVWKHSAWVQSAQKNLKALYTPQNMTNISLYETGVQNIYRTPMDEFFVSSDNVGTRYYKIEWCSFQLDDGLPSNLNRNSAGSIYSVGYNNTYSEMKEIYDGLMSVSERKKCYKNDESYEKIRDLAAALTENCANDLEKASALEAFFLSPDFVYDDNFSAVDSSVENFIFKTRRGICSDYATAMTLLCREAGLYSRYVEGFLVNKRDSSGNFYVTAADSHAYVQVWLDGYGWTDFDPTSGNIDGGYIDGTFLIFGGAVLFAGLTAGGILLLIPIAKKRSFLRRAAGQRGREQAMTLFPELNRVLHEKLGRSSLVYTVSELKERTLLKYGVDISALADNYERAAYGGKETEELDFLAIYNSILRGVKEAEKAQKRQEKKRKKNTDH